MSLETERKTSGIWSVLYQPDTPQETVDRFQRMFDYLGRVIITDIGFNMMSQVNLACVLATAVYAKQTNQFLSQHYGFSVDQAFLSFNKPIEGPSNTQQTVQSVLRITEKDVLSPYAIIDPACYLFRIPYIHMPIAVGNKEFLEGAMGELYSNAVEKPVTTKLRLI